MHTQRTFEQRIGYFWPCVAPATILSDEAVLLEGEAHPISLREEASADGLCFVRVVRCVAQDLYRAEVAASYELLVCQPLSIFVTAAHLEQAIAYDARLLTSDEGRKEVNLKRVHALLREREADARPSHLPVVAASAAQEGTEACPVSGELLRATIDELDVPQVLQWNRLMEWDPCALSVGQSAKAQRVAHASPFVQEQSFQRKVRVHTATPRVQQALLCAVVDRLVQCFYATRSHLGSDAPETQTARQICLRVEQLRRWQRQSREPVVHAVPVVDEQQRVRWDVTIGVPEICAVN